MSQSMDSAVTRLDIGLSKEDQARIESLRAVQLDNKSGGGIFGVFKKANKWAMGLSRVNLQEKVTFYQLLAVMINAGVPLIQSLYVLSDQMHSPRFKEIIRSLAQNMEEGTSLSISMAKFDDIFSDSERGMVASGEASGNLNEILKDIAHSAEKSAAIISRVKGAMIYPIAVILIMIAALFLMLTLVVPKITALFTDSGEELPPATKLLIALSDFATSNQTLIIVVALLLVGGVYAFKRSKRGKYTIDMLVLRMPIFGRLVRNLMLSRFARMLASLMDAGIPIVKALEINAEAVGNEVYKKRIIYSSQDVAQGIPLGENLKADEFLFPPMVSSMVLVGEETANLSEIAKKIADYYESEVDTMISSLSKLMEPVILVMMGLGVGFVVSAIMQPIIALSDLSSAI